MFQGSNSTASTATDLVKLLSGNQATNKAYLGGGTEDMLSFMYYYQGDPSICTPATATDITGDGIVDAHTTQDTCVGGGWYQMTESPPTYCLDTCAANGMRWCQHEATHAAPQVTGVAAGDLNGDGLVDMVSISSAGSVVWYESAVQGAQWTANELTASLAAGAKNVLMFDVEGDGDEDIVAVTTESSGTLMWFRNNGGAGFDGPFTIQAGLGTTSATAELSMVKGDVIGDSKQDIIICTNDDTAIQLKHCPTTSGASWSSTDAPAPDDGGTAPRWLRRRGLSV
jgi:hypothetical protein